MSRNTGRHELSQNFLVDRTVTRRIVELVAREPGPLVEWGTGDGSLTRELAALGRPLEGIDVDGVRARRLDRRTGPHVCIREGDILRHAPPAHGVVVCNVPFHITTPVLRHLLAAPDWSVAVLVTQWEVARKRAGVGGATQLTAQWWPWFAFALDRRIPATSFSPRPTVDAGLLTIRRREDPLVPAKRQRAYQAWVAQVFSGRGRGLADVLRRNGVPHRVASGLAAGTGRRTPLPRDLDDQGWARAWRARGHDGRRR